MSKPTEPSWPKYDKDKAVDDAVGWPDQWGKAQTAGHQKAEGLYRNGQVNLNGLTYYSPQTKSGQQES
jgi:hypothetical protein